MTWHASLQIEYTCHEGKSIPHYQHQGPLRILQSLYPEGDAICHNVLVHPPGGLVGGDTLDIRVQLQANTHALITTPGATRFYRSPDDVAVQSVRAHLRDNSRLEWLPLESLAYSQCRAENRAVFELDPGAELMGWDITALGLPTADLPFEHGDFLQQIEVPGIWREQGSIEASDHRLMNGPLGLAGHRCTATLFFVSGQLIERERREKALDAVRALITAHPLSASAGVTSPHPQVLVVRVLAPLVEPAMELLKSLRVCWRDVLWQLPAVAPRVWST